MIVKLFFILTLSSFVYGMEQPIVIDIPYQRPQQNSALLMVPGAIKEYILSYVIDSYKARCNIANVCLDFYTRVTKPSTKSLLQTIVNVTAAGPIRQNLTRVQARIKETIAVAQVMQQQQEEMLNSFETEFGTYERRDRRALEVNERYIAENNRLNAYTRAYTRLQDNRLLSAYVGIDQHNNFFIQSDSIPMINPIAHIILYLAHANIFSPVYEEMMLPSINSFIKYGIGYKADRNYDIRPVVGLWLAAEGNFPAIALCLIQCNVDPTFQSEDTDIVQKSALELIKEKSQSHKSLQQQNKYIAIINYLKKENRYPIDNSQLN